MPLIGFVAGALTTAAFVPQVMKSWRSRSVEDFSMGMLVMFNVGVALWVVYGWMTGAMPVVVANAVTLLLTVPLMALKLSASVSWRPVDRSKPGPPAKKFARS